MDKNNLMTLTPKKYLNTNNYGITKKIILFTNARDELHIKEWAIYHRLIGFDIIVIFDHKSKLPLSKVFYGCEKQIKIIDVSNLDGPIKMRLMNVAKYIANALNMDWMIYLDADEFIVLNKFTNVKKLLNAYNYAHSLGINWLMFGSNFLDNEPTELLIESYTKSKLNLDQHVKTFVRPREIINATNPHFYNIKTKNRMFGIDGKMLLSPEKNPSLTQFTFPSIPCYIAHYVTQSLETYLRRKSYPRDDTGTFRTIPDNIKDTHHTQYNDVNNYFIKNKYAKSIKMILDKNNLNITDIV